jgi:hypothetical protein
MAFRTPERLSHDQISTDRPLAFTARCARLNMDESQFRIEYSWEDLKPVRPLVVTIVVTQILGCLLAFWIHRYPSFGANLWAGGALATFPGFLLGLLIQHRTGSAAIAENKAMVRRIGLIALLLSLVVFVFSLENF